MWLVLIAGGLALVAVCGRSAAREAESQHWSMGPPTDPHFFPLAVWLQDPRRADQYRAAGFNTYVALWKGPTEEQLAALKKAGMRLICEQNKTGLSHLQDPTIIGWMHGDEPDNAQSQGEGKGWGAPIPPQKIVQDYERLRAADSSRPVMLNLGQGVAWDGWYGRGSRSRHPEDYPEYLKGCDIASFDIYPVNHEDREVAENLSFVARGVQRLVEWSAGKKIVWNCLECTRIGELDRKPTPHQVRCEAWMSLIRGSQGLIYFVHQFKPQFHEAALLEDNEMLQAVTRLNREITELAPALHSPTLTNIATVESSATNVPVAITLRRDGNTTYLFAVSMANAATTATFSFPKHLTPTDVEVLGENRKVTSSGNWFKDQFAAWDVHLYRWPADRPAPKIGNAPAAVP
jgi:hypothetical protein